ncbi:MAG: pilus (MSHA type) biogenesis protein MshL [Sulfuriflexus sp.]|nr:pilus (MSHA type) biogenesis protein MshL [Sulfuriflexus sp.]
MTLTSAVLLVVLSGCSASGQVQTSTAAEIDQVLQQAVASNEASTQTPQAVSDALLPPININVPVTEEVPEARFDIGVDNAPASVFFMGLVKGTPYNMVVHPDVAGQISLSLKDVTIPEVMEVLRDVYGYESSLKGSLYQVLPRRLQSRIFEVNYLNVVRVGKSQTRVSSGQITQPTSDSTTTNSNNTTNTTQNNQAISELSGSQVETNSEADFWSELRSALTALVGNADGRSVIVNPQSGIVVVRALPSEIRDVSRFLGTTQDVVERQVILEAKIIEVELSDGFQSGINWTALGQPGQGKTVLGAQSGGGSIFSGTGVTGTAGSTVNLQPTVAPFTGIVDTAFGGVFSLALNLNDFTAFIELLETQGNVQVLSSPRVSTINNQKAVIKVGNDEFFVTGVTNTTVTGTTTTSSPTVTLTPFFSGIALDVIPQIDEDDNVILHIHPTVSTVSEQVKNFTIGGQVQSLPLARSSVRESDSIVRAKSNQIIVIGGLMQNTSRDEVGSTPGLSSLPLIGSLFNHTRESSTKSELVILLRPIVVNTPAAWKNTIEKSARRFRTLTR